ncbi:MAG: hypothetical protein LBQ38_11710 [Spirochaetaceae bacterium]|jgi:hypothetical protein|nr:hypothetical protein [Spirochaetaceae bacterium]
MKLLDQLLNGGGTSHIMPFLWMHGEPHDHILEEINKIEACGIREICLEARPHPDFAGPHWWSDVDLIMGEARKRGMRIWVLDDNHFPTGNANDGFAKKYPEKAKWYLGEDHMDLMGPADGNAVLVAPMLPDDARLLGILAFPMHGIDSPALSLDGVLNWTDTLHEGFVYLDLPSGYYRLFVFFVTQTGGGRSHYMNLIDEDSVEVLLKEVYEPHYLRYKDDFGKTFAGFFSDEPEIGNTPGYCFEDSLGKEHTRLPWSDMLERALKNRWGNDFLINLAALWYDGGERSVPIRYVFMDEVTRLVGSCFSGRLGSWCRERGVEYIGHIIEDNNAHARLGCSIGHYFREQEGQHMAGIDVVHAQIVPGFTGPSHRWIAGDGDGEFFHFGLAKMGASAAGIDPKKKGRALCEMFGNYGWAGGIGLMKWLTDHMLVRGINRFVPHAFSPRFPEYDCPPHFYARGHNPQYRFFAVLMKYMNRMAHLLEGGTRHPEAAVLYHGDAEWTGGKTMLFQKPVRELMEHQLDCDIIPPDVFTDSGYSYGDGEFSVNGTHYRCIVVPGSEYLPLEAMEGILNAAKGGLPVFFVDSRPLCDTLLRPPPEGFNTCGTLVSLRELGKTVRKAVPPVISPDGECKELRLYTVRHEDGQVILFFNEHITNTVNVRVRLPPGAYTRLTRYNGVANKGVSGFIKNDSFPLSLDPGEAALFLLDKGPASSGMPVLLKSEPLECEWTLYISPENNGVFSEQSRIGANKNLPNLNDPAWFPNFSGVFRYVGTFTPGTYRGRCLLYFPKIGDCAAVSINGKEAGVVLGNSGRVDITELINNGNNELSIEIANTLVWQIKDPISAFIKIEPTGMTKRPVLEYYT